jgi:hypothetical protein
MKIIIIFLACLCGNINLLYSQPTLLKIIEKDRDDHDIETYSAESFKEIIILNGFNNFELTVFKAGDKKLFNVVNYCRMSVIGKKDFKSKGDIIYKVDDRQEDLLVKLFENTEWQSEDIVFNFEVYYKDTKYKPDTLHFQKKYERLRFFFNLPSSIPENESSWIGWLTSLKGTQVNISWASDPEVKTKGIIHIPFFTYESRYWYYNFWEVGIEIPVNLQKETKAFTSAGLGLGLFHSGTDNQTLIQGGICWGPNILGHYWFIGIDLTKLYPVIAGYINKNSK